MFWDLFKKKKEVKVEPAPQAEPAQKTVAVEFVKEETPTPTPVKKTKKKVKKDEAVK